MSQINKRTNARDAKETDIDINQLQHELQALKKIQSSLQAVERMVGCLNQNIHIAIKNADTLSDLNQGWEIFFNGRK